VNIKLFNYYNNTIHIILITYLSYIVTITSVKKSYPPILPAGICIHTFFRCVSIVRVYPSFLIVIESPTASKANFTSSAEIFIFQINFFHIVGCLCPLSFTKRLYHPSVILFVRCPNRSLISSRVHSTMKVKI